MNSVPRSESGGGPPLPGQVGAGPQLAGPTRDLTVLANHVENDEAMRVLKFEFRHRALRVAGLSAAYFAANESGAGTAGPPPPRPPRPPFGCCNCAHWARVSCSRISSVIAAFSLSISLRA
jgi:hypothetical protein